MNIIHQSHNTLLHRKEISGSYASASNPGYAVVQKALAEKLGVGEDTIVIKRLSNLYGSSEFSIEAFAYDSAAHKDKFEPKPKQKGAKA